MICIPWLTPIWSTRQRVLFQWDSSQESNGLHQFRIEFYSASNQLIASPAQAPLTLRLDNKPPDVELLRILHDGKEIPPCEIGDMKDAADGVALEFKAYDPEGAMLNYTLSAEWGSGESAIIKTDSYANPANRNAQHIWTGVTSVQSPKWVPPRKCAYLFRISAYDRTTNGYSYPLRWVTHWKTAFLTKPGAIAVIKAAKVAGQAYPFGFDPQKKTITAGVEPKKLGLETLAK